MSKAARAALGSDGFIAPRLKRLASTPAAEFQSLNCRFDLEGDPLLGPLLSAIRCQPLTVAYIGLFTAHVTYAVRSETSRYRYPSRPELRDRFGEIERTLGESKRHPLLLSRELSDPVIVALLSDGDPRTDIVLMNAARLAMRGRLTKREVRWLAALTALVQARNPPAQGRGKLYPAPASGPDALEYCALIVSMAWHKDAGEWPGKDNATCQALCELLWRSAGGKHHSPSGYSETRDEFTAWRNPLINSRRYRPPHRAGALVASFMVGPRKRPPPRPRVRGALSRFYKYPRGAQLPKNYF
jgi:hypothetical protein